MTRTARNSILLALALAAVLGVSAVRFVQRWERFDREVPVPATGPARRNPLLAAERLLNRSGIPADSSRELDAFPPPGHVLILAAEDRIVTHDRAERLLAWVERGGRLIVGPHLVDGRPTPETHADPLLERLDVRVGEFDADRDTRLETNIELEPDRRHTIGFPSHLGLLSQGADGEDDIFDVVESERGDGSVLVLSDLRFAHNQDIGELDHAVFLLDLVRRGGQPGGVLLVYAQHRRSLAAILVERAGTALLALGCCVVAAAWRAGARFGPVLPPPAPDRRSLIEHLDAAGRYLWSNRKIDALLEAPREELLRRAEWFRPGIRRLPVGRQAAALARRTGLAQGRIEWALSDAAPGKSEHFVRTLRTLAEIRRRL